MQLGESKKVWLNPTSDINYLNYEEGLIRSFRLGFQDPEWYKLHKDNFCNSIRKEYPELLPYFVPRNEENQIGIPNNFLGFYPDEFIRYGKLEKVKVIIDNREANFWVVKIPAGLQVYHSSRSLGLNHSDFPIRGYSNRLSPEENEERIFQHCPNNDFMGHQEKDVIDKNVCTYVSYYSSPYATREYLRKGAGFGSDQIKYAYGVGDSSDSKNRTYNDRLRGQADEYYYGVQAYKLVKDSYYVILGLDDFLIERPDLGRENMRRFKQVMEFLSPQIQKDMKVTSGAMENFLDLINSVTGIGSLHDNYRVISRDYNNKNFDKYLWTWLKKNTKMYTNFNTRANTAGYIRRAEVGTSKDISDLRRYKGVRFSTYEHDRPVMNMLGWLFGNYPVLDINSDKPITISGFVSSSMFVPSKGDSTIKSKPFTRTDLQYYIPNGVFHSEIGMFFAPDVLERNKENKFDLEYSINYIGIVQELRKYKTSNIMHYDNYNVEGFHQGHLLEHSTWVSMISYNLLKQDLFNEFSQEIEIDRDVYLIAGYFHDLGKSGECKEVAVYKAIDPTKPKMSVCSFVTQTDLGGSSQIVGMKYYDIPEHPEKGYEFLKGYKTYKKFTLIGTNDIESYRNNAIPVYLKDWEEMFDHLNMDSYDKKLIRIAVGAHWYFGDSIRQIIERGGKNEDFLEIGAKFIRDVELFNNDEFFDLNKDRFYRVLIFVIIISVADIIGSEYNPFLKPGGLSEDKRATLINYLPNISLSDLNPNDPRPIVDQIVDYALNLQNDSTFKQSVLKNTRDNVEQFVQNVSNLIYNEFEFMPGNNYSLLYNLVNSYPKISDIKRAYGSKFPKIIAFDLDQTMFAIQFHNNAESTYHIYPATFDVMKEAQLVRKKYFPEDPTYIAVTSRHYSPASLLKLLQSKEHQGRENPLYYENFDYIISRYTGPYSKIENDMSGISNFFENNGYPSDGFILDVEEKDYAKIGDGHPNFPDLDKISKHGHFNVLKNKYEVEYEDILTFDDDEKYFTEKGLGPAKDVYVAGVLKARKKENQGIRVSLFKSGVAYYVFDKINDVNN